MEDQRSQFKNQLRTVYVLFLPLSIARISRSKLSSKLPVIRTAIYRILNNGSIPGSGPSFPASPHSGTAAQWMWRTAAWGAKPTEEGGRGRSSCWCLEIRRVWQKPVTHFPDQIFHGSSKFRFWISRLQLRLRNLPHASRLTTCIEPPHGAAMETNERMYLAFQAWKGRELRRWANSRIWLLNGASYIVESFIISIRMRKLNILSRLSLLSFE